LDAVDVSEQAVSLVRLNGAPEEIAGDHWRVQDLELPDGFAGALAAPPKH
jgi:hypothetical protein